MRLTDSQKSEIGKFIADSNPSVNVAYDVTDELSWSPGMFGESQTSCWWGDYNEARVVVMPASKGRALRLWKRDTSWGRDFHYGYARCWLVPMVHVNVCASTSNSPNTKNSLITGGWVGFNCYGPPMQLFAKVAQLHLEYVENEPYTISYKPNVGVSGAYINGSDTAFVVIPTRDYESLDHEAPNFRFEVYVSYPTSRQIANLPQWAKDDEYGEYGQVCSNCGNRIHDGDEFIVSGDTLCERCWEQMCVSCEHCGEHMYMDDATEVRGGAYVCAHCLGVHYEHCDDCGEYVRGRTTFVESRDGYLCADCLLDLSMCDECHEYFNTTTDVGDGTYCDGCLDDKFNRCETCGTYFRHATSGDERHCDECHNEQEREEGE